MNIPDDLLPAYLSDPKGKDEAVRQRCNIPDNRYYTVSVWPVAGVVTINRNMHRDVAAKKISKSDQQ